MLENTRMFEKEEIQSRGFKNVMEKGKLIGFQVPIRLTTYRGLYLSQLTEATVTVNGEKFEGDQITWTIQGKTYLQKDMQNITNVHWSPLELAVFNVKKPGGLELGLYDVEIAFGYSQSYIPSAEWAPITTYKRKMTLAGSLVN
jgi:hypothetical protein